MLFGVVHTHIFQSYAIFSRKISPSFQYAPHPLILRQRGDYSKNISSRSVEDCQSVKRRTKKHKHLKSATAVSYGKRTPVPRSEAYKTCERIIQFTYNLRIKVNVTKS